MLSCDENCGIGWDSHGRYLVLDRRHVRMLFWPAFLTAFFQQRTVCILEKLFKSTVLLYSIQEPMGHDLKFQIVVGMGDGRRSGLVRMRPIDAGTCQKSHDWLSQGFLLQFLHRAGDMRIQKKVPRSSDLVGEQAGDTPSRPF